MSLPSLYSLTDSYRNLAHQLADMDMDATTVHDTIEASGLLDDIATKGQNLIFVARSFEQHSDLIKAEIKRLQALDKHRQHTADKLREYLLINMIAADIERIEGPLMTISIRNNPEAVDVFDGLQVPAAFMRQPETPPPVADKVAIKAALKKGDDVPGCRLTRSQKLVVA